VRQRYAFWAIALGISLAVRPGLQAMITPVNYPTPMPVGTSVSGMVTNIDPVNKMIQVREPSGMVQTIRIDEHVQILHNGQPINLNAISLGDSITVIAND